MQAGRAGKRGRSDISVTRSSSGYPLAPARPNPLTTLVPREVEHCTNLTATLSYAEPSEVDGACQLTIPSVLLTRVEFEYAIGQLMIGGWLSMRVTPNVHVALFPDVSVAVHVT